MINIRNNPSRTLLNFRSLVTVVAIGTLLFNPALFRAHGQQALATKLNEDQRILHVLNRLGFGARPGDLERVKAIGLQQYINQQLAPEKIRDEVAEAKLKNLSTLNMSTAELYEKYPQPGQLLRQLERRGELPAGLAEARDSRVKGGANAAPGAPADAMEMKTEATVKPGEQPIENPAGADNQKYRQALRADYQENGLQQPQRITAELQASRILRAVYSERQLQEVMVDFWTNHFNVFAGKGADRWLLPAYDRDTIRPNAMGKFSTLLQATAQSPAMLFYLDNFQSVSPDANQNRRGGPLQRLRAQQQPLPQQQRRPQQR